MYSRILVPLDGSAQAELALQHASDLAKRYESELLLLRGVRPPSTVGEEGGPEMEAEEASARAYLAEVQARLAERGIASRPLVPRAEPARAILTAAKEERADLIVVASYSESGWERWVQGSVPGRVLRNAKCPMLLLRFEPEGEAAG